MESNLSKKRCLRCKKTFVTKPSHYDRRKYCSYSCAGKKLVGKDNPNWRGGFISLTCRVCSISFLRIPAKAKNSKFCSNECRWNAKRKNKSIPKTPRIKKIYRCASCQGEILKGRRYCKTHSPCNGEHTKNLVCEICGMKRRQSIAKDRKVPRMCRKCSNRSENWLGEKNPNWKGGITTENKKIRASDEYKEWRRQVFERDQYQCVNCGKKGNLHADHIRPFATHKDIRLDINNGRTLCIPCHKATPSYLTRGKNKETIVRRGKTVRSPSCMGRKVHEGRRKIHLGQIVG